MKCYDVIVCDICGSGVDIVAADTAKLGENGRSRRKTGFISDFSYCRLLRTARIMGKGAVMKMTGMMGERNFFSQQPFWEVTKQRENSLLCMEDFNLRLMRTM